MKKTLVIVGLGLIGGSMALALKGFEDYEIVGVDVSQPTLRYASEHGVGDRVRHLKYGDGTVTNIVDGPRDYQVTVQFDGPGQKIMYAAFAKLKKI